MWCFSGLWSQIKWPTSVVIIFFCLGVTKTPKIGFNFLLVKKGNKDSFFLARFDSLVKPGPTLHALSAQCFRVISCFDKSSLFIINS